MVECFYCFAKTPDYERNIFSDAIISKDFETSLVCLGCTSIKVLKAFYVKSLETSSNSIQKPII